MSTDWYSSHVSSSSVLSPYLAWELTSVLPRHQVANERVKDFQHRRFQTLASISRPLPDPPLPPCLASLPPSLPLFSGTASRTDAAARHTGWQLGYPREIDNGVLVSCSLPPAPLSSTGIAPSPIASEFPTPCPVLTWHMLLSACASPPPSPVLARHRILRSAQDRHSLHRYLPT
eukprot:3877895-Rhodomonas_salina.1